MQIFNNINNIINIDIAYWSLTLVVIAVILYTIIKKHYTDFKAGNSSNEQSGDAKKDFKQISLEAVRERLFIAQADKDLSDYERNELPVYGPLISVIKSKRAKHMSGGIFLISFALLITYSILSNYIRSGLYSGSNSNYMMVFIVFIIIIFVYYGLLNFYECTYNIRLYKKGLVIKSFFKKYAYLYKEIKSIKTYEYRRRGLFQGRKIFAGNRRVWVCDLTFDDNTRLYLDTDRYNPELFEKIMRWEKNLHNYN
ncbi:MAG: hypothetical protein LBR98_03600 [Syntrophomonadaceae bacterium]|nr:hypothetical protein [Syntrophomonadaceae bacterium]